MANLTLEFDMKSRFNLKTCEAVQTFRTKNCLVTFGTTNQQTTTNCDNKQCQITTWFEHFHRTAMMRSDLSTFLPTLGLLGAVLKKIRLTTLPYEPVALYREQCLGQCTGHVDVRLHPLGTTQNGMQLQSIV